MQGQGVEQEQQRLHLLLRHRRLLGAAPGLQAAALARAGWGAV